MTVYDRCAELIVCTIDSPVDPTTLASWGHFLGASVSTLRSRCVSVDIRAKDALDFARLLRAVIHAEVAGGRWDPAMNLEACDPRTLQGLFRRGGLGNPLNHAHPVPLASFLNCQRLIKSGPMLDAVRHKLTRRGKLPPGEGCTSDL